MHADSTSRGRLLGWLMLVGLTAANCRAVLGIEEFPESPDAGHTEDSGPAGAGGNSGASGASAGGTDAGGAGGGAGSSGANGGTGGRASGTGSTSSATGGRASADAAADSPGGCAPEGATCGGMGSPIGLCRNGSCNATSCFVGGAWYDASERNPQSDCDVCNPIDSRTVFSPVSEGSACKDGATPGTCRSRACCSGCWDGQVCQGGTAKAACGTSGRACVDCSLSLGGSEGNCTNDVSCLNDAYQHYFVPIQCNAGTCGYGTPQCCGAGCTATGCS